jgi:hypothetical protein
VLMVKSFMKFHLKKVTSLYLACFYVVMLPKCCLVLFNFSCTLNLVRLMLF